MNVCVATWLFVLWMGCWEKKEVCFVLLTDFWYASCQSGQKHRFMNCLYIYVCVCVCVCLLILDYRWEWYGNFTFVFGQNPDYNNPFNIEWKLSISFLNYSFSHKLVLLSIADYKIAIKSSKTVSYSCEFSKLTGMLKFKDLKFT